MTDNSGGQSDTTNRGRIDAIMSGRGGAGAALARAGLSVLEIGYRLATWVRNFLYDVEILRSYKLGRPTVSVGNLTTGGTGKTPMVALLAAELKSRGHRPAVLMRGYGKTRGGISDEAALLESSGVIVEALPNRRVAAGRVLAREPDVDVFLLDDGMQHRRVRRDQEIVLFDAAEPFGFGHLLPRGMLRETTAGLQRAHAMVITRSARITSEQRERLMQRLKSLSPRATIYCCDHVIEHVLADGVMKPARELAQKPYVLACGIGNPAGFVAAMQAAVGPPSGTRFFPDHHDYRDGDVTMLREMAASRGADAVVVTGKDWVKLKSLPSISGRGAAFYVAELELRFSGADREALIAQVMAAVM